MIMCGMTVCVHYLTNFLLLRFQIHLFLQLYCLLCCFQCHLCLGFETVSHALLLPDLNFLHHGLHHVKFALLLEVKVAVGLCSPRRQEIAKDCEYNVRQLKLRRHDYIIQPQ